MANKYIPSISSLQFDDLMPWGTGHYLSGGGGLVQIGGGPPFFLHGLKGGGGIKKYANVLPAKMLKASSGCHQQIQPIKTALYNNFF